MATLVQSRYAPIAQLFARNHSSIQGILAQTGGIQLAPRLRSRLVLMLAECEEISRSVVAGDSLRSITRRLGRAPSTISRDFWRMVEIRAIGRIRLTSSIESVCELVWFENAARVFSIRAADRDVELKPKRPADGLSE